MKKYFAIWLVSVIGLIFWGIDRYADYGPTVVVENHDWQEIDDLPLTAGKVRKQTFMARHENLGIVSIKFNTGERVIDDTLEFGIREIGKDDWYYRNVYKTDQFRNLEYFPFGFPEIAGSKGKEYELVVRSLGGTEDRRVILTRNGGFLTKYAFSKNYLWQYKWKIPIFGWNKLTSYGRHIKWWQWGLTLIVVGLLVQGGKVLKWLKRKMGWLGVKIEELVRNEKFKKFLTGIFFGGLFLFLWRAVYYKNMQSQYGDTTFAAQLLMNVGKNLKYESSFAKSLAYVFHDVFYKSSKYVCSSSLETTDNFNPWGHFYLIVYFIGWTSRVFDIFATVAFWQAMIYAFVLLFAYLISRRWGLSRLNSWLITLVIWQHPLWRQGLWGQFYYNRFFLLFSGITILLFSKKKINYWLVGISSLLAVLVNEIYGIALAMIYAVSWFLFKKDGKLAIMGLFSFLVGLFLTGMVQKTAEPGLTQNLFFSSMFSGGVTGMARNFWKVAVASETVKFVMVNLVGAGLGVWTNPKLFLSWIFLLLPNILVYVGRLGWSTHYHMSYFIPLIWLFSYSFSRLKMRKLSLSMVLVVILMLTAKFDPEKMDFGKMRLAVIELAETNKSLMKDKGNIKYRFETLRSKIEKGEWVSLPEAIAYNFTDYKISYYPADIDRVDKVVLFYNEKEDGDEKFYSINYGQQDEGLDRCIRERMRKNEFEVESPIIFEKWAIFAKKNAGNRGANIQRK